MSEQSQTQVSEVWNLAGQQATLCCGRLVGHLDASAPNVGLTNVEFGGVKLDGSLWAFGFPTDHPMKLKETYLRGHDLVAHYEASEAYPFDLYCYWNAQPTADGSGVTIRLTISWLTDLLDSDPELILSTTWPGEIEFSDNRQDLIRKSGDITINELPHPSDMTNCVYSESGNLKVDLPFLEKGVIRRARFLAVIFPIGSDASISQNAVEEFCREPLPLTT